MRASWRLVRAARQPESAPSSVSRFAARARRRRLRSALPWLVALGVLVLLGTAFGVVYGTGAFGVDRVRVVGTHVSLPDDVRAAAAVRTGTPLARVDLDAVARRVEVVPAVRTAKVTRDWPNVLVIRVVERSPAAAVPVGDGFAIVDDEGVVFDSAPKRPPGLTLLRLGAPGDAPASAPGGPTTVAGVAVLRSLPVALRDVLVELVAEAPTRIRLLLTEERTIVWGDATENAEKARVAVTLLNSPAKVIDVSAPSVVTVK